MKTTKLARKVTVAPWNYSTLYPKDFQLLVQEIITHFHGEEVHIKVEAVTAPD